MKDTYKYLEKHEEFLKNGLYNGLCEHFNYNWDDEDEIKNTRSVFAMVAPTIENLRDLEKLGHGTAYWGNGEKYEDHGTVYTSLRQTIVLLCAAINGEL